MEIEQFKELFFPLHKQLFQTAYILLKNREDAEDLIQEAYLKLWNKRDEVVIQSNPPAYCHTLVRRMCIDFLRQQENRQDSDFLENTSFCVNENPEQTIQSNPPAYCHTLVRRMCIDFLRQQENRQDSDFLENTSFCVNENPEQTMEIKDECRQLKLLIRQLPHAQRKVMWMRDVCECSFEEIEQAGKATQL